MGAPLGVILSSLCPAIDVGILPEFVKLLRLGIFNEANF
jgi:hypothetical protein